MVTERWIWIVRWPDFQHYPPERDRGPAWIKDYPKQLQDDRYLGLSGYLRGVLHGIRLAFAQARYELPAGCPQLSRRLSLKVTPQVIEALNDAGFIEVVSRPTLDQRIEQVYASRAPARSRREKSKKEITPKPPKGGSDFQSPELLHDVEPKLSAKDLRQYTGCRWVRGQMGATHKYDPLGTAKPPVDWPYEKPSKDEVLEALAKRRAGDELVELAESQFSDEVEAIGEEVDF